MDRQMIKPIVLWTVVLVLAASAAFAHSDHPEHGSFEQAEAIINAKIPCDDLSEEQLEMLGDYYMEQMHPGEAHESMDEMMGGEGSASLRQVHINMAKAFYCGEHSAMSSGMMSMMMGGGQGMMGSGSMGTAGGMGGMMGMTQAPGYSLMLNLFTLLYFILLIALIVAVALWILNQWKKLRTKGEKH